VFDAFSVGNILLQRSQVAGLRATSSQVALNFVAGLRSTLFRLTLRYIVGRFQRLYQLCRLRHCGRDVRAPGCALLVQILLLLSGNL
jgi:hypothetical protein